MDKDQSSKYQPSKDNSAIILPTIILLGTQLAENLGAVARCMANFDLNSLRLVAPRVNPDDPQALATAVGAKSLLTAAKIFNSFEDAIADLELVFATTACRRDLAKNYETPRSFVGRIINSEHNLAKVGIVFGPERTGLTNLEIARCQRIITIPVNPDFPSLNLAQSVAIVGYELFIARNNIQKNIGANIRGDLAKDPLPGFHFGNTKSACQFAPQFASQGDRKKFLDFMEGILDEVNFWRVMPKKPRMWLNIQNMFSRLPITSQDIKTIRGMIDMIFKANK